MIRILHFVSSININSGVMSLLMNYYRNVDRNVIQFDFIYFIKDGSYSFQDEIEKKGGRCFFVASPSRNPLRFEIDVHQIYIQFKEEYYAIHIHDIFMPFFLWDCKCKTAAKKVIVHAHLTVYGYSSLKSIRNRILSIPKYLIADEFWACSKDAGIALFGKGMFKKKGRVINNAISLEKFVFNAGIRKRVRKELDIEDDFVVGHVGWFNPQKNHRFLIEVFENIRKKIPNAKLILIGEGLEKKSIEGLCREKGIKEKVLFLGVREDVNIIMNAFDVFCFPSKYEGLGIALIEAQAIGIPCVYSDRVPTEANILRQQNKIISVNASAEEWGREINNIKKIYSHPHKELKISGFDIKTEAKKIVGYYLQRN